MQFFTNARAYVPASVSMPKSSPKYNFSMLSYKSRNVVPFPPIAPSEDIPIIESSTEEKKMKWGEPIWLLLHTISYKIKNDAFLRLKSELLQMIYTICINLPCPDCSKHAKEYLDKNQIMGVRTKDELQLFLFTFHNVVNQKKGFPIFDFENFQSKYSTAITTKIIQNFMFHFKDRSRSTKLMASDFNRTHIVKMLTEWFQRNIQNFMA